jgi:5-methylcytosine-specific restriction endonuclease McrA
MTKPSQYATHWLIRLYHLSCKQNDTAANYATLLFKDMSDKSLTESLMSESRDAAEFVYDPVGYERFKRDVSRLSNFCKECAKLPSQPKLPPITMHAVYTYFSQMEDAEYENKLPIIVSWMECGQSDFVAAIQSNVHRQLPDLKPTINKIWEKTANDATFEEKKKIYSVSFNVICSYTECRVMQPVLPKQKKARKNLTKNIRNEVWNRYYEAANNKAKCYVCDIKTLDRTDTSCYDYAHIGPHSQGGKATVDNLIPTCKSCNSEMGEQNLKSFQAKHYPDVFARYV